MTAAAAAPPAARKAAAPKKGLLTKKEQAIIPATDGGILYAQTGEFLAPYLKLKDFGRLARCCRTTREFTVANTAAGDLDMSGSRSTPWASIVNWWGSKTTVVALPGACVIPSKGAWAQIVKKLSASAKIMTRFDSGGLRGHCVPDELAVALASCPLQELRLNLAITDAGVFDHGFKPDPTVDERLEGEQPPYRPPRYLVSSHIKNLALEGTLISDKSLAALAPACSNLRTLSLARSWKVSDYGLDLLLSGSLTHMDISSTAASLTAGHLTPLDICSTAVTDAGLATVAAHCPHIEVLLMADTAVSDAGCTVIATTLTKVHTLAMSRTQATDRGLASLAFAGSTTAAGGLRELDCDGCSLITNFGIAALLTHEASSAASTHRSCKEEASKAEAAFVSGSSVSGDEAGEHHTYSPTPVALSMRSLTLCNTAVQGSALACVATHCVKLETLSFDGCASVTIIPPELSALPSLRSVSCVGCPVLVPRAGVVAKGSRAILECLREQYDTLRATLSFRTSMLEKKAEAQRLAAGDGSEAAQGSMAASMVAAEEAEQDVLEKMLAADESRANQGSIDS
jgi:hypothetical protein